MLSEDRRNRNKGRIGSLLKDAREREGYTQKALAAAIGLEYYTMISQLELGYISVPPALWIPLADTLRLNRADFVLTCINEYQPEVYSALFGNASKSEVVKFLTAFQKGAMDESNGG